MLTEKRWVSCIGKLRKAKIKVDKELLKKELFEKIGNMLPKEKFGILFSGGVDSSFIALVCKQLRKDFTCYAVGLENSEDVKYAKIVAKELKLKLKVVMIGLSEAEDIIRKTTKLLNTDNPVKVGVGCVFYAAMEQAKKDKIKHLFSGLGSEEIFAGYQRHEIAKDIQKECWNGLNLMYNRDLERDFTISNCFKIKLLIPFLDKDIIKLAMNIPAKEKLNKEGNKLVLRKIAYEAGLSEDISFRKKRAAQYGSRFDRAILRLAKKNNFKFKKDYLASFLKPTLGVLYSSGKDSTYALHLMKQEGYPIKCLINVNPDNEFSYMYHKPLKNVLELHAKSMGWPLIDIKSKGEKEKELKELEDVLKLAKQKYNIEGVVTGALYSKYQKNRVEKICRKLRLKCFNPLWHIDQEKEMRALVEEGFKIIFTKIAAYGLDKSWLGRIITDKDIDKLVELNKKIGLNIAGEGGEFESLVIDCPLFKKKIKIKKSLVKEESENNADLVIKEAVLA